MRTRTILAATLVVGAMGTIGCGELGFTSRVLWRVPSPDHEVVAVCQEIPAFDGPGYSIRLERADGTVVRRLYQIGDGDPCSEVAWSADGRTLAVLSGHVARVRFVDVAWALAQPSATTEHWSWRQEDFSTERQLQLGRDLRFVGPLEIELTVCPYNLAEAQRTGERRCTAAERRERVRIPLPIMTAAR